MCELNLMTIQCVTVKLLSILLHFFFHFADGPFQTCFSDGPAL